jgi:UDP-N-acetylmuramoyl-L-alanyl-D-glutamate--2,6-diaminopimelate ligase
MTGPVAGAVTWPETSARYPSMSNPVTDPRGRPRVRWHDLLAGLDRAGYQVVRTGDPDLEITAITHDSRQATPGTCFACIPGAVTDGHDHAAEAVARGAVALLVERPLPLDVAQIEVPGVRAALGPVAATLFGHPSAGMRVLGVTGTNGKTTTTSLLEQIARHDEDGSGDRVGVVGTVGARVAGESIASATSGAHTTPEASDLQALLAHMRDVGATTVAMEVSSHALHQHRVDGVQFAAVCFTNLSHEHLDYHGSLDAYFEAKASLFTRARTPAAAVNVDDARGVELAARAARDGLDVWTYSVGATASGVGASDIGASDIGASDVVFGAHSTRATIVDRRSGADAVVELPLVGSFNLANALGAAATARAAGFSFASVVAGLGEPLVVPGRMERIDAGQPFAVLVDYAHTPDALSRVLAAVRPLTGADGKVICVFGCGGDRDPGKRPLMGEAVAAGADVAVLTSDNPRSEDPQAIADAVLPGLAGAPVVRVELDRRSALAGALADAAPGDVVVIAGKGHETGQTANGHTVPFDDRVVAREELGALGWS